MSQPLTPRSTKAHRGGSRVATRAVLRRRDGIEVSVTNIIVAIGVSLAVMIGVAASVIYVLPWAQDSTAKSDLSALQKAEQVYSAQTAPQAYGTIPDLVAKKALLKSDKRLAVALSADKRSYCAATQSAAGSLFYITDDSTDVLSTKPLGRACPSAADVADSPIAGPVTNLVTYPNATEFVPVYSTPGPVGFGIDRYNGDSSFTLLNDLSNGPHNITTAARMTLGTTNAISRGFHITGNTDAPNRSAITAAAGQKFTASVWSRPSTNTLPTNFVYGFVDDAGRYVASVERSEMTPGAAGKWSKTSVSMTAPTGAKYLVLMFVTGTDTSKTSGSPGDTLDATGLVVTRD